MNDTKNTPKNETRIRRIERNIIQSFNDGTAGPSDSYTVESLKFGYGLSQEESEELMMILRDNYSLSDGTRIGE